MTAGRRRKDPKVGTGAPPPEPKRLTVADLPKVEPIDGAGLARLRAEYEARKKVARG